MIGANQMIMHQSIALLRLSPRIDDMCYAFARVFKLYEKLLFWTLTNRVPILYSWIKNKWI